MLEYEKQEKIEHNFLFGVSFIDKFIRMGNSVNSDIIDCNAEVTQTSWHI